MLMRLSIPKVLLLLLLLLLMAVMVVMIGKQKRQTTPMADERTECAVFANPQAIMSRDACSNSWHSREMNRCRYSRLNTFTFMGIQAQQRSLKVSSVS
jgi:cell division protein FtsL